MSKYKFHSFTCLLTYLLLGVSDTDTVDDDDDDVLAVLLVVVVVLVLLLGNRTRCTN